MMPPLRALFVGAVLGVAPWTAVAHEGHPDAANEAPTSAATSLPRMEWSSPQAEVVVVREARRMLVYVDDYPTNAPLDGLTLHLRCGPRLLSATVVEPGLYAFDLTDIADHDARTATVLIRHPRWSAAFVAALPPPDDPASPEHRADGSRRWLLLIAGGLPIVAAGVAGYRRRRSISRTS